MTRWCHEMKKILENTAEPKAWKPPLLTCSEEWSRSFVLQWSHCKTAAKLGGACPEVSASDVLSRSHHGVWENEDGARKGRAKKRQPLRPTSAHLIAQDVSCSGSGVQGGFLRWCLCSSFLWPETGDDTQAESLKPPIIQGTAWQQLHVIISLPTSLLSNLTTEKTQSVMEDSVHQ